METSAPAITRMAKLAWDIASSEANWLSAMIIPIWAELICKAPLLVYDFDTKGACFQFLLLALECDDQSSSSAVVTVLAEIDSLPGSQGQTAR